tara:strand:+ start:5059 stop:5967 length:909 start_codon:yes stop_codon:yes gene_type:complete
MEELTTLFSDLIKSGPWLYIASHNADESIEYLQGAPLNTDPVYNKMIEVFDIGPDMLHPRMLYTAKMLTRFPNELIGTILIHEEESLVSAANKCIQHIEVLDIRDIGKQLVSFNILFNTWRGRDRVSQFDILSELFYRYRETIDDIQNTGVNGDINTEYTKAIREFMNKILATMRQLDPNYMKHLHNYKYKHIEFDAQAHTFMYSKLKEVFWDNIHRELYISKNYKILSFILDNCSILLSKTGADTSCIQELRKGSYDARDIHDITTKLLKCMNNTYNIEAFTPTSDIATLKKIFNILESLV